MVAAPTLFAGLEPVRAPRRMPQGACDGSKQGPTRGSPGTSLSCFSWSLGAMPARRPAAEWDPCHERAAEKETRARL